MAIKLFYVILYRWIYLVIHVFKAMEYATTPRMNPEVINGLRMIITCKVSSLVVTNLPIWFGTLVVGVLFTFLIFCVLWCF